MKIIGFWQVVYSLYCGKVMYNRTSVGFYPCFSLFCVLFFLERKRNKFTDLWGHLGGQRCKIKAFIHFPLKFTETGTIMMIWCTPDWFNTTPIHPASWERIFTRHMGRVQGSRWPKRELIYSLCVPDLGSLSWLNLCVFWSESLAGNVT